MSTINLRWRSGDISSRSDYRNVPKSEPQGPSTHAPFPISNQRILYSLCNYETIMIFLDFWTEFLQRYYTLLHGRLTALIHRKVLKSTTSTHNINFHIKKLLFLYVLLKCEQQKKSQHVRVTWIFLTIWLRLVIVGTCGTPHGIPSDLINQK